MSMNIIPANEIRAHMSALKEAEIDSICRDIIMPRILEAAEKNKNSVTVPVPPPVYATGKDIEIVFISYGYKIFYNVNNVKNIVFVILWNDK